jgi:hypothetical protein
MTPAVTKKRRSMTNSKIKILTVNAFFARSVHVKAEATGYRKCNRRASGALASSARGRSNQAHL